MRQKHYSETARQTATRGLRIAAGAADVPTTSPAATTRTAAIETAGRQTHARPKVASRTEAAEAKADCSTSAAVHSEAGGSGRRAAAQLRRGAAEEVGKAAVLSSRQTPSSVHAQTGQKGGVGDETRHA